MILIECDSCAYWNDDYGCELYHNPSKQCPQLKKYRNKDYVGDTE